MMIYALTLDVMCRPGWTLENRWHHWYQKSTVSHLNNQPFESKAMDIVSIQKAVVIVDKKAGWVR